MQRLRMRDKRGDRRHAGRRRLCRTCSPLSFTLARPGLWVEGNVEPQAGAVLCGGRNAHCDGASRSDASLLVGGIHPAQRRFPRFPDPSQVLLLPGRLCSGFLRGGTNRRCWEGKAVNNVVIVDDAEIGCLGWLKAVEEPGHHARAMNWDAAGQGSPEFGGIDLMILVLRRDPQSWDRYRALGHGRCLRGGVGPACRMVAVLDPREMANPMIGLRLASLGVDEVIPAHQLRTRSAAADLIDGQLGGSDPRPSSVQLAARRVGRRSDPNQVISHLLNLPSEPDYLRAFDPYLRQNQCGLSRRQALTLRRKVCEIGDLAPDPSNGAGGPVRNRSMPRWSEVVAFVNECRGWDPDDEFLGLIDRRPQVGSKTSTAGVTFSF